jgi:hypothetical protein
VSRYAVYVHPTAAAPKPIESLPNLVAGLTIRSITHTSPTPFAVGYDLALELERPSHTDAAATIESALLMVGMNVSQMILEELATDMIGGATLGAAAGAAFGRLGEDVGDVFGMAAVGLLIGAAIGDSRHSVKARYRADLVSMYPRVWQFTTLSLHPDGGLAEA